MPRSPSSPSLLFSAPPPSLARDNNPDLIEVRKYTLTMPKIENLVAATDAINKMVAADPSLKQKMDAGADNNKTLDQKVRNIDTNFPQVAAILHSHGLSTREYLLVTLAFINDVSFVGMKKSGMIKDYPPNSVTPKTPPSLKPITTSSSKSAKSFPPIRTKSHAHLGSQLQAPRSGL